MFRSFYVMFGYFKCPNLHTLFSIYTVFIHVKKLENIIQDSSLTLFTLSITFEDIQNTSLYIFFIIEYSSSFMKFINIIIINT